MVDTRAFYCMLLFNRPVLWSSMNEELILSEVDNTDVAWVPQTLSTVIQDSRAGGNNSEILNVESGQRMSAKDILDKADGYAKGLAALGLSRGNTMVVCACVTLESASLVAAALSIGVGYGHPYIYEPKEKSLQLILPTITPDVIVVGEGQEGATLDALLDLQQQHASQGGLSKIFPSVKHYFYDDSHKCRGHLPGFRPLSALTELGQSTTTAELNRLKSEVQPTDAAMHFFTSGSTGLPKCVVHNHATITSELSLVKSAPGEEQLGPIITLSMDVDELLGYKGVAMALTGKTSLLVIYRDFREDPHLVPAELTDLINSEKIEHSILTGECTKLLITQAKKHGETFPSLKTVILGGQIVTRGMKEQIITYLGAIPWTAYGMTELLNIAFSPILDRSEHSDTCRLESRLFPKHNSKVKLVDKNGNTVKVGTEGQVMIRSATMLDRYKHQPEATRSLYDENGFVKSGDIAVMYPDGSFVVKGRTADAIRFKVFGETVYPGPIEEAASQHMSIKDISVVAVNCSDWRGDEICYCIQLHEGECEISEEDLINHCMEHGMDEMKRPTRIFYLNNLPRTSNQRKVSKSKIREYVKAQLEANPEAGITQWFAKLQSDFSD